MDKFLDEELVKIHECLKDVDVAIRRKRLLPPSDETDYYINILRELTDRLTGDEKLAIYLLMTQDTVLNIISGRESIEIMSDIIEIE